ncbi:hypothetical protein Patl1_03833 [Pistacia atlantica]|uniref:Uncharacterized protein n=1 Tax=Pistacia atlantica TaxID=434234 RepID=A0ACC1BU42_9ROSI|nr:hypothetical protein Patl1_03833 [Pistacia atlantica]
MAEGAVNSVIQILSSLLFEEIKLLGNAKQGVEEIKRELESIKSFLKDADTRTAQEGVAGSNEAIKTWDSKIRSVSLFNVDRMPTSFMTTLVDFKLIKVLDFEDSPLEYLPKGMGNLFHLHYLRISREYAPS